MGQSSRMSWTKILEQIVRKEKRILLQTLAPRQNLARPILKNLLEIMFSPCIIRSNLSRTILKKKIQRVNTSSLLQSFSSEILFKMPSRLDSVFIFIVSQKVAKCKHFLFQKGMTIFQREEEL